MKLFATVAELTKAQESLGAMEVRATTAEAAVADFTSQLTEAKASLAALTVERDAAQAALAEANAKIVANAAALTAKDSEVTQVKATVATQVAAQAAATVAALGHTAVPAVKIGQSALSVREQYASMKPGPERIAFRNKHASELSIN